MALDKDKIEKLQRLIPIARVLKRVLALENNIVNEKKQFEALAKEFKQIIDKAKFETIGGIRQKILDVINKLFIRNDVNKKLKEKLNEANAIFVRIDEKMSKVRNGKDADEKAVIKAVLSQIEPPRDGITPTKEELLEIIKPLIPEPKKGKDAPK